MPKSLEHSATSWKGQQLKHKPSLIDQLDPRLRVVTAALFAFFIVLSDQLLVLVIGLITAFALAILARLNLKRTLRRVIAMDLFIVGLLIMLPFTTPGTELFSIMGLSASQEGLLHAIMIGLKANASVLCLLSLIGTMNATLLGHTLAHLKVPDKLVHLLLFTVRYLDVIGQEFKRMRRAMQARAFVMGTNWHTWRSVGYLIGMLLVRSLERSERIMAAMKCRGFKGRFYLLDQMTLTRLDYQAAAVAALWFALLAGLSI